MPRQVLISVCLVCVYWPFLACALVKDGEAGTGGVGWECCLQMCCLSTVSSQQFNAIVIFRKGGFFVCLWWCLIHSCTGSQEDPIDLVLRFCLELVKPTISWMVQSLHVHNGSQQLQENHLINVYVYKNHTILIPSFLMQTYIFWIF